MAPIEFAPRAPLARPRDRAPRERDLWYALVDDEVRYGAHHVEVTALADGNYRYRTTARVLVDVLASQEQEITVEGEYVVTPALRPVSMRVESRQLSGAATVTGRTNGDVLELSFDRAGVLRESTVALDPSETVLFSVSVEGWLGGLDAARERATAKVVDELTCEVDTVVATRLRRDATGSEWRLEYGRGYGERTLTLDERGVLVRWSEGPQATFVRCTEDEARELEYLRLGGRDTLVFPLDREIRTPHRLEELVVRLTWRDVPFDEFRLEDARQRILERTETGEERSVLLSITAPPALEGAATIPVDDPELAPYLAETDYVKPTDPEVLAAAREATAGTTNAAEAVAALSRWVFDHVEGELIAETLTGPEVLACGRGKCSEYATLFASMARAIGIPTRVALGERMVAGSWMGHMWNEVWIGRWVTVDASADEVGRSLLLLKLVHSDTVGGTQPLRWALPESLSISIEDFRLGESGDGIDGVTYTNVDYRAQLTAPAGDWTLVDESQPGLVAVRFDPPNADDLAIHFVAFEVAEDDAARDILAGRIQAWERSFDTTEVLADEALEVHGAQGHTSHLRGRDDDGEDVIRTTEVLWIRGSVGYLTKLTGHEPAHQAWRADFQELIESFRYLDE